MGYRQVAGYKDLAAVMGRRRVQQIYERLEVFNQSRGGEGIGGWVYGEVLVKGSEYADSAKAYVDKAVLGEQSAPKAITEAEYLSGVVERIVRRPTRLSGGYGIDGWAVGMLTINGVAIWWDVEGFYVIDRIPGAGSWRAGKFDGRRAKRVRLQAIVDRGESMQSRLEAAEVQRPWAKEFVEVFGMAGLMVELRSRKRDLARWNSRE